jgi:HlyD family secretion protein
MKISALGVEEQRVNIVIDLVDGAAVARQLGDGYRVEVRVVIWRDEAALQVPIGALFRRGDQWAAFVIDNDIARLQIVQLGQRNESEGQITVGLVEGQIVVLHPPDTLEDGRRVRIRASQ